MAISPGEDVILLSAFAANPDMSSETGIGWIFTKAAGKVALERGIFVVALMNKRSAERVTIELNRLGLAEHVDAVGVQIPRFLSFLETNPRLTRFEYLVWWMMARRVARAVARRYNVVLADHVTFATEMFPTPVSALPSSVMRVWGPVGASGDIDVYDIPPISAMSKREKRIQHIRDFLAARAATVFSRNIDLVLAQNDNVYGMFKNLRRTVRTFPNVVISDTLANEISRLPDRFPIHESDAGIHILAVGHLIPRKRFEIAIAAMQDPRMANCTLTIAGQPLPGTPSYLPELVAELRLNERVRFVGKVPRAEVLALMNGCDVLVHPSAREGASGVVGEATAVGIPVVCFSRTGASSVLDASGASGVTIPAAGCDSKVLVDALLDASKLPRLRSKEWTEDRFEKLLGGLYADAMRRNFRNIIE